MIARGGVPLRIGVVGAGIGGLAFAALAARGGSDVTVFDRFDAPRPVGSGLVIQPVGQAVLDEIGVGTAATALGAPIHRMTGREVERGRRVLDVSYDAGGTGRFGLGIHRASLFDCLLSAALDSGVTLEVGREGVAVDQGRIVFGDGSSAGFDLVVDAAGAASVLSPLRSRPLGYGAIWSTVPWPKETSLPDDHLTQRYRRADRMIGVLPIGRLPHASGPLAALFWSLPRDGFDAWRDRPLEDWKAEAEALWPEVALLLGGIGSHDDMTMARYSHGTLRYPAGDRIAHIGDAAHRASPQLGQGANMALLDARALSLAIRRHRHSIADALGAYVKARRFHVLVYQAMSAVFTPQYQSDSRALPVLRDRVLFPISRVPLLPRVLSALVSGTMLPPLGGLTPRQVSPRR